MFLEWFRDNAGDSYTSSHVIAEIGAGIERLRGRRKATLQEWLQRLSNSLGGRVLNFNATVAMVWAQQEAEYHRRGCAMPMPDSFIAATARRHNLTIVTRNYADFQRPAYAYLIPLHLISLIVVSQISLNAQITSPRFALLFSSPPD
jgi:predicted nucleic acid-binding protein